MSLVIKSLLVRMGGTAIKAMFTKSMLVWALRLYAKGTETKVDDYSVDLLEALLDGDSSRTAEAAKKVAERYVSEKQVRANAKG
jgi:hypothetical protein